MAPHARGGWRAHTTRHHRTRGVLTPHRRRRRSRGVGRAPLTKFAGPWRHLSCMRRVSPRQPRI